MKSIKNIIIIEEKEKLINVKFIIIIFRATYMWPMIEIRSQLTISKFWLSDHFFIILLVINSFE